jgi:hypothetical protein
LPTRLIHDVAWLSRAKRDVRQYGEWGRSEEVFSQAPLICCNASCDKAGCHVTDEIVDDDSRCATALRLGLVE